MGVDSLLRSEPERVLKVTESQMLFSLLRPFREAVLREAVLRLWQAEEQAKSAATVAAASLRSSVTVRRTRKGKGPGRLGLGRLGQAVGGSGRLGQAVGGSGRLGQAVGGSGRLGQAVGGSKGSGPKSEGQLLDHETEGSCWTMKRRAAVGP